MFSLHLDYPAHDEEVEIVRRTTLRVAEQLSAVVTLEQILAAQQLVVAAPVSDHVIDYAVRLAATPRGPLNAQAPQITAARPSFPRVGRRTARLAILDPRRQSPRAPRWQDRGGNSSGRARCRPTGLAAPRVITNYRATGAGNEIAGHHQRVAHPVCRGEELLAQRTSHAFFRKSPSPKIERAKGVPSSSPGLARRAGAPILGTHPSIINPFQGCATSRTTTQAVTRSSQLLGYG